MQVNNLMIEIRMDCKNSHLRLIIKFEIYGHNNDENYYTLCLKILCSSTLLK